jgi:hypothetical protein
LEFPIRQDVAGDGPIHKLVSAAAAAAVGGPVLVCWCSDTISDIAMLLLDDDAPPWPKDRFDLVWVFERTRTGWLLTVIQEFALEALRTVNHLSSIGGVLGSLFPFQRLNERRRRARDKPTVD